MDFDKMKRKELQALCKKHGIPANLTNLEMANKLSSIFKVNDEKPLTQGRSCLKVFDETVNDRESDVVDRTLKKVKFSPDDEIFEFTKLVEVKSRGRRKSMLHNNSLSVRSHGVKIGILDSPVRVTRSRGMNLEDGVSDKKGRTRRTKDNVFLVNESEDEVGMTKRRSLRNKEVVSVQERREENEGVNEGLRTSRRVKGEINANKSAEELDKRTSEKEIDRAEKRDKKVTFASDDQIMECMEAETKTKEMKRGGRRKSIAHTLTSHVQNEVDAKVRDELLEKPAERITRSRNLKSVVDDVSNKRNQTRAKEVIERNVKLLCTEFVESSVEAASNEVKVTTRRSQQNNVVEEASQTALKRSKRQATKAEGARFTVEAANDEFKATTRRSQQNRVVEEAPQMALTRSKRLPNKVEGARLTDDISKDKMVTRDRTRNQSNLVVEASTSEVVPQLDEQVEVPLRRSDRRKSVFPLEKLRSDEAVAVKEKRNLNINDNDMANKGKKDEPLRASKRSKRLATQVEDSVLAKDDIVENKVVDRGMTARNQSNLKRNGSSVETRCKTGRPTDSQGTVEVGITHEEPGEAPVKRSNRRKSVVPSLEKLRADEVAAAKDKRNLDANDDNVRGKSTKEEPEKALKRSKGLAQQVEDSVPAKDDIAENKVEERRLSGRSAAKANIDTKILDGSVQEEIAVVKEERRCSERSASKAYVDTKILGCSVQEEVAVVKEERRCSERSAAKASVVTKILDSSVQEEIAVVKEERRRSERKAAKANVVTETLDSSAQKEKPVVKEEKRRSGRTAASLTLVTVSYEKKESGENKLTKINCTPVPEKSSTKNKFALQDLDSLKQSTSRAKTNVEAAAVDEKTSTAGKKQQGQQKRSNVEVEAPTSDDMVIVRESDSKECDVSGSEGAMSFLKSGLNELEAVKNDVNMVFAGSKDEAVADSSPLAENLKENANASPSENNSTFKCPPYSDPFSSKATPDENVVEDLLQSDHEAPASKGLCPGSVLADDAIPKDITSDKQEHSAIAADYAEEFDTELSNEVIDNSSLHHSDNMEENLESGLKEQSETGCIVDEGLTYGEQEPASNLADDAVPNDLTLDKKEHGAIAADNADEFGTGLSNEVLDNYSLNQSDNMEDNLESDFKKQSETGFIVTEGIPSDEQELTITNYAREFDAGFSSNFSLDSEGAFNLSNKMEIKNSESGPPMEKAEAGFIAKCDGDAPTFTTQGELHAEGFANLEETTKEFSPISQHDNDGLSSAVTFEKSCDHGKQSTFRPRNSLYCGIQTSSELAKYNEGEYLDDQENEPDEGVRSIEFEATEGQEEIIDDEQLRNSHDNEDEYLEDQENGHDEGVISIEFEATEGQEEIIDDEQLRNSNDNEDRYLEDQENEPDEGVRSIEFEATEGQEVIIDEQLRNSNDNEDGYLEDQYTEPDQFMQQLGHSNGSEGSIEAAASAKIVSSPIKAVLDFQEPAVFGDDIALEDSDEEKQGEELKVLFATPCVVSHSKEESKASLEGDSRLKENKVTLHIEVKNREIDENLSRRGQASSTIDNSSLQSSVRDCDEHGQGEILKSLFATPFGGRSSKVEIATSIELNETSSQYKHICHANENTFHSSGNDLTLVTPLKDTSKDEEAGEELKSLFATPLIVSRSIGGEPYRFQSQLSGEGLDSSGKRNPSEPVSGLIEDEQGEHLKNLSPSPISVKSTNEETTSTKGKYSQSHEMETFSCSGLERNVGECEDGPAGVDQAPETSHIASFNYGDESEQEDQLKVLFASPINTQPLHQMDGTSSKTEEPSAQGLSNNTGLSVANPSAVDLSASDSIDSKQSEYNITVEKIKETPECIKGSSSLEEENNEGQDNMLSATSAKSMTPLRKDELSSQEPKTVDVALSGEMVRVQGMNTIPESRVQEIVDIEEHGIDEIVADRDLLLRDTSKALEEDLDVEIAKQSTSAVISEPTFNDADISEEQMLEINKSSPGSSKASDKVYNEENTEDHLKLLFATPFKGEQFATPIKGTSPSRLSEASACQLKKTMITIASEMVGKEPKCKGFEFSGDTQPVTPLKDTSKDEEAGEELKSLFATPLIVSRSIGGEPYRFQSQLSGEGLDSSGKRNPSEPVGRLIKEEQGEHLKNLYASPISVKSTNEETTSSHEMETFSCSGLERSVGECEDGPAGVDHAPETSHIASFNYGDESEQEDQLKVLFASPINTQPLNQMDGTSSKTEEDVNVEIAKQSTSAVISEPTINDADTSEQMLEINKSSPGPSKASDDVYNEENTEYHLKLLFATPIKGTSPSRLIEASTCQLKTTMITIASEMVSKEPKCKGFEFPGEPLTVEIIDESCESRKGSCLLQEKEEQFKRGALFATPSKSASPLQLEESFGCLWDTTELALSTKGIDSKARNKSQGCPLGTMEAKESCEPSKDSEALQHIESSLQEPEIEEAVADKDLLLIDTSEYPEENIYVEIANKNTSAVISEPACGDHEFSEQQMVLETHKSNPESIKQSDAVNEENSEDHLKLLFATPNNGTRPSSPESIKPYDAINEENSDDHLKLLFSSSIKETSPSKLDEDSTCQLKTATIAAASETVGKEPKRKGSEFSGEPLTVEVITGGSSSTKGSCLFKENEEQFKGGPLFATSSKGTSPVQLEESPCCEEDIFKDMDGGKFLSSQEQSFAQYEDCQLNEMIDDTGEATLNWFQTNDGSALRQTELETQKENDSVPQFELLHEKGEVTEDDALAEGQALNRQMTSQESPEDEAAKGGSVSDAVCQQPNMLLSDIETDNITHESLRKTYDTSISAESGILDIDAESTTLRSQEKVIITLEETRGDEEQSLEVRNTSNAFQYNIPNNDEVAKEIPIVWPADKQFHFPEHSVIENGASTREFTSSTIEGKNVIKEVDLAVQKDRLTVFESNESTSMNVKDSVLTTQMDLPGILCEEAKSESNQGKSCEANQQDEFSFDKKDHETPESVVTHSYRSRANISFIEEGFAGEDTLMSEKKNSLAAKKEPFTPAGVAKTSLAEHLNSTVKKKNVRTILIHGTPNKQSQKADMKENDPNVKGNIGTLTALRPEKRRALQILPWK